MYLKIAIVSVITIMVVMYIIQSNEKEPEKQKDTIKKSPDNLNQFDTYKRHTNIKRHKNIHYFSDSYTKS